MTPVSPMVPHRENAVERGFPARPESASAARKFVLEAAPLGHEDDRSRLTTLVSELATNAILHARTPFKVKVSRRRHRTRVDVTDGSTAPPVRKVFLSHQPTGRGLVLLESLADRWGVVSLAGEGKTVWFEIDDEGDK
jgi:anti-sigma regulatory factor (Ser/Thr protein kinase)